MNTTCALCYGTFEAKTSYGICSSCFSRSTLHEWDRLQSAYREARRLHVPACLELCTWLAIISDFAGKCAYCQAHTSQYLDMVDPVQGLVSGNVVPICHGCREHKRYGWQTALTRVQAYLAGEYNRTADYDALFLDEDACDTEEIPI